MISRSMPLVRNVSTSDTWRELSCWASANSTLNCGTFLAAARMSSSIRCRYGSARLAWLIPMVYLPSGPLHLVLGPGLCCACPEFLLVVPHATDKASTAQPLGN